ncbi:MAG: hypothetical protein V1854_05915 [Methanobacteriota archaeon]
MKTLKELLNRLNKLTQEERDPKEYFVIKKDHGDGKPADIVQVREKRGTLIRDIPPEQFNPGNNDTVINIIESEEVSV